MTAIRVELQLADGSFVSGMLRAGQSMADFNKQLTKANPILQQVAANGGNVIRSMERMDQSSRGFLGTLRDVSLVIGLVSMGISKAAGVANSWIGDIVRVNAEMERLRYQMQAMSTADDPMKDAADSVNYLREQAANMPFTLKTITSAFVKLKATGTDPMSGSLKAIADGIAAFGGTNESLERVVLGITQMSGKSVIQMEEMRQQLGEQMPAAMQLMARSMGVSVAELTKAISTGTVESKSALQGFYAELERTYGGSAQRMMQTFSGQVSQMHTNLQNLATNEGGSGFFDQVKAQLVDFNQFLRSDLANTLATQLGQGLSSLIGYFRTAVETVWDFRESLLGVAQIAATGIGLTLLSRSLSTIGETVRMAGLEWKVFRTNMAEAASNIALGLSGFKSAGTTITGLQYTAMGLKQTFSALLSGFAAFGPLAVVVGSGAYMLADYFGLLSNKIDDAYQNLQKYGAETRAQAQETTDAYIEQLRKREQALLDVRPMSSNPELIDKQIAETQEKLKSALADQDKLVSQAAGREDRRALDDLQTKLDERLSQVQGSYNKEQLAASERNQKELADIDKTNKSKRQIDEEYQTELLRNQKTLSEARRKIYADELLWVETQFTYANEAQRGQLEKQMDFLRAKMLEEDERQRSLDMSQFGIHMITAPKDDKKAVERGVKQLESLQAEVAGLNAELSGANNEVGKMYARIAQGDFGSIEEGGDAVRKLHDELVAATAQKETLDKVMEGRKKAQNDLDKVQMDLLEKQMEIKEKLSGDDLNPAEKFLVRLDNGYYKGLGPIDNIRKAIVTVVGTLDAQGVSAESVARVMQQNTFSDTTVQRINTVTDSMRRLAMEIQNVGAGLGKVDFSTFASGLGTSLSGAVTPVLEKLPGQVTDRMKQALDYMMKKGWSRTAASGIVGNLVGESGMNSAAIGDNGNAFGLAQWNDRGPAMKQFLGAMGKEWTDFFGQLDFVDHELRTTEGKAGGQISLAKDAQAAADIFMRLYERPSEKSIRDSAGKRAGAAMQAYDMAGDTPASQASQPAPQPAPTLSPLPTYDVEASQKRINDLEQQQIQQTKDLHDAAEGLSHDWDATEEELAKLNRQKYLDKLKAETAGAAEAAKDAGEHYKRLYSDIQTGQLGKNRDPHADIYKPMLEAAQKLDETEKQIAATKAAAKAADSEHVKLEEKRAEIGRSIAEQQKRAADPTYKADSNSLNQLTSDLDAYLAKLKQVYGEDSDQYKEALTYKSDMLRQQKTLDVTTQMAAMEQERQQTEKSLMTETEVRQREMQRQLALIDQIVAKAREAGMGEVAITEWAEKQKAAIRAKNAQEVNPLQKQMKEWGDIQGNLAQASTRWMDSLAGGLTDLIMGTGDLKSAINGILKDIVNMGLKSVMSGMFGGQKQPGSSKAEALAKKTAQGGKKAAPIHHTGGIVGSAGMPTRRVSSLAFRGAPRFHTGGIIGGNHFKQGEVPIIAKKGEGVFTPEQMQAMGGFQQNQQISISAPITVNGSAGSPEQNNDLAQKMAKQMEATMRSVVADEVRKQSRPGNYLYQRGR